MNKKFRRVARDAGWFRTDGAYVLFDGQFGSTGKGLLASYLAEHFYRDMDFITTNAGPNSGHTGYVQQTKVFTQQVPVAAIAGRMFHGEGLAPHIQLNAGAQIDIDILATEVFNYGVQNISVHPHAAIIKHEHRGQNMDIASTGKGTGPAQIAKMPHLPLK